MIDRLELLKQKREEAFRAGGEERIAKLHEAGKLIARERLEMLLDRGSFEELGFFVTHRTTDFGMGDRKIVGDGVVSGFGRIDGRTVFVFAQDFSVFGGTMSESNAKKICQIMDLAMDQGAPIIGLNDSGGARIQEGVRSVWEAMPRYSCATRSLPASCRKSRRSWGRAPAAPCTRQPSPTSSSWSDHTSPHVRDGPQRHQDGHQRRGDVRRTRRLQDARIQERRGPSAGPRPKRTCWRCCGG